MRLNPQEFRDWDNKAITLLGMSGIGKTYLARKLRQDDWFHYSGDYRIGTRYLNEKILDQIKSHAMQVPFLRRLLLSDAINIDLNISIDNLEVISTFLGRIGDPENGGLGLHEFKERQNMYRRAEIAAMKDVPEFIERAHKIYGYHHFVNDAGGSLSEVDDQSVLNILAEHTLIIYIEASQDDQKNLIQRAKTSPKPLYYHPDFFMQQLEIYLQENQLEYAALIDPDDFVRWIFPQLLDDRIPRYSAIAKDYGYTIRSADIADVNCVDDFLSKIEQQLENDGFENSCH